MNRFFADDYSNNENLNRNLATETKFVAAARRSLCVSTRSTEGDEDALPIVWTTEFSATISPAAETRDSFAERKKREQAFAKPSAFDETTTWAPQNERESKWSGKPFAPLGLAGMTLPQIERAAILETLLACEGNRRKTALKLAVSEKTIYNKIKVYKLKAEIEAAFGIDDQAC